MVLKASNINMKELALNYSEVAAGNVIVQTATLQQEIQKQLHHILLSYTDFIQKDTRNVSECWKGQDIPLHVCSGEVQFPLSGRSSLISLLSSSEVQKVIFCSEKGFFENSVYYYESDLFLPFPCLLLLPCLVMNKYSSKT